MSIKALTYLLTYLKGVPWWAPDPLLEFWEKFGQGGSRGGP